MSETAWRRSDWQADVYHRVAQPHGVWAGAILDRLRLAGDEIALDAGCGTGKLAAALVERLPRGRVIGVDASPAMIGEARRLLPRGVELHVQDLMELELPRQVDVVVSSAAFHWIPDHERLFARLAAALRPGGRLEAQFGGSGNVSRVVEALERLRSRQKWRSPFSGWSGPWNFADASETEAHLHRSGFSDVRCWVEPYEVRPDDPRTFLRTVVLGAHLARIPDDAQDIFINELCDEMAVIDRERGGDGAIVLDYARLNVSGIRGS